MATLVIAHNIFLTKEERYKLHSGEPIEVTGVNVPVWFEKGNTSEPAQEVFCKYRITNTKENKAIVPFDEGYNISIPKEAETIKLLDIKDGGCEWLYFRQYGEVHQKKKKFNIIHDVEFRPLEDLTDTLTF